MINIDTAVDKYLGEQTFDSAQGKKSADKINMLNQVAAKMYADYMKKKKRAYTPPWNSVANTDKKKFVIMAAKKLGIRTKYR